MSKDIRDIVSDADRARTDARRNKPNTRYAIDTYFGGMVNEPIECVNMLKQLNETIDAIYAWSDTGYYLDYIWNSGTLIQEALSANGITEEWLTEVGDKLIRLRGILFGLSLDYRQLYEDMYHDLLGYEAYWHRFHEETSHKLQRENDKLKGERK